MAAENGHVAVLLLLLKHGANKDAQNKEGATALYLSSQNNHLACVEKLLAAVANVNLANING